jgi:hypothetical protein
MAYIAPEKRPPTQCILCGRGGCLPSEGSIMLNVLDHRQWMHVTCIQKAAEEHAAELRNL